METAKQKNWKLWLALAVVLVLLTAALCSEKTQYALKDLAFFSTERTETEWKVKNFARENGLFFSQYPTSLVDLLEINPEAEAFVLNYPLRETAEPDLSGYDRTAGVPLFLQWDPQWGYETYGSDYLAITGCGPTCLAMAAYYLTGSADMNPRDIAVFAEENGYYVNGHGSSWTLISEGSAKLGLTATELPLKKQDMMDALEAGNPIILAMGKGDFTSAGHYIVLTGLENGLFRVNDPNSIIRSQKLWSYEQIESQIRNIWAISR